MSARKELMEEREKWFKERSELKGMYEEGNPAAFTTASGESKSKWSDMELENKTLRELNSFYEKNMGELNLKVRMLED